MGEVIMALTIMLALAFSFPHIILGTDSTCPQVRCLTKLQSVNNSMCTSVSGGLTYINPCLSADEICDQYSGKCKKAANPVTEALPGEKCNENSLCYGHCVTGLCMGWLEFDYCDYQITCHVGLRCVNHTCLPLLEERETGCRDRTDCANGLICQSGECVAMFSLPNGTPVKCEGQISKSNACESGLCSFGQCISLPEMRTASPQPCSIDSDCTVTLEGVEITSTCDCTASSFGPMKMCSARVSDIQYREKFALLREWTHSAEIRLCHSHNSLAFACIERVWEASKATRLKELVIESKYHVSLHMMDQCLERHYLSRAHAELLYVD